MPASITPVDDARARELADPRPLREQDRANVGAPFKAFFNVDRTGDFMVSHNLSDIMKHVANAITHRDQRYRGYIVVVSGPMIVAELNALGLRVA